MPIAIDRDGETCKLTEEQFRDEDELQAYLERSPYLLISESEPQVVTVQREVGLPSAGSLDLLLVDAEGVPVAVEVKLGRNSQARREVIAQAFDYISDLTRLTIDELDDAVDGALIGALDELARDRSGLDLRKQCGTNLRLHSANVRVAIASVTWRFAVGWFAEQLNVQDFLGTDISEAGEIIHVWGHTKKSWL